MRKRLEFEQIRAICQGAVRVTESEHGVRLFRFTEEQENLYRQTNDGFYKKSLATAGMKLCFETDSTELFLKVHVMPGSTRTYFSFDVTVDGRVVGHLDNFMSVEIPKVYTTMQLPLGEFSKSFELGIGVKKVCIYMPWSVAVEIRELCVDEHAFIKPIKPQKKLLVFGDSITQGYDALRPSNRYASRLAEALEAEEINKGIGAERFFPPLAKLRENFEPDYIVVAYGTNDWKHKEEKVFLEDCCAFYAALSRSYPNSIIFALTPIWRKYCFEPSAFGDFEKIAEDIQSITEPLENVFCVRGFDFVPHDEELFADMHLHPNDRGFDYYFKGLWEKIRTIV